MYRTVAMECLETFSDPATDTMLLPDSFVERDNSRRIRHYKTALRRGMNLLPTLQREQIRLHYEDGLRKADIARRQNRTCSSVSKSMRAGENTLRSYIELYMDIFDALEKEFLLDDTAGGSE